MSNLVNRGRKVNHPINARTAGEPGNEEVERCTWLATVFDFGPTKDVGPALRLTDVFRGREEKEPASPWKQQVPMKFGSSEAEGRAGLETVFDGVYPADLPRFLFSGRRGSD